MEASIYAFIRKYSWRQQLVILALALSLLPLNYVSLELPKTIVNRALGDEANPGFMGYGFDRLELLWLLCGLFLLAVVISGGLKYVLNVYAGIVAERMLRRLRYQLYSHVLRFPLTHFRRVSQGELVQMLNAETEALGGFVGEAVSTPAVQGGLLLTSLVFIFVQDPVLGLAAVALYPIQLYIIPKLQAQVNRLGKLRVQQVRRNAERISETVAGVRDIHAHAATRFERARFSQQLAEVFWIRFAIYKKKFLIKFLNNFISQLGPFFFFSIGGYLVIQGDISLGALVAAVGAQKDIAGPWRELLTYYQSLYDVKIKYEQTVSQFVPAGLRDERLLDEDPADIPDFKGELKATNLSVLEDTGEALLDGVSFTFQLPAHIAVLGAAGSGKEALTLALAGLIEPSGGRICVQDHDLCKFPTAVLGRRVAYVGNPSYVFSGSIADNLLYGLKSRQIGDREVLPDDAERVARDRLEAERSGNGVWSVEADWVDFAGVGITETAERAPAMIRALELTLFADDVYAMGLRSMVQDATEGPLAEGVLQARAVMQERLAGDERLRRLVERFDPDRYNTNATVAENLLFGTPIGSAFDLDHISKHPYVLETLKATGLDGELTVMGFRVAQTMVELFADLPPDHEYFRQFSFISPEDLPDYRALVGRADIERLDRLSAADQELLLALPFKLVASRHRLGLLTDEMQAKLLQARAHFRANLPEDLREAIDFFEPDKFNRASSLQDNILFGKIAYGQAQAAKRIGALVDEVVASVELRPAITEVGLASPCGFGGARLSVAQRQKLALARSILKRPELLILYDATSPLDAAEQAKVRDNVLEEFAGRTVIWAVAHLDWAAHFAEVVHLDHGRLAAGPVPEGQDEQAESDEPGFDGSASDDEAKQSGPHGMKPDGLLDKVTPAGVRDRAELAAAK